MRLLSLLSLLAVFACSPAPESTEPTIHPLIGSWRAVLSSPGGELPFGIEISAQGEGLTAFAINGEEILPFSDAALDGDDIRLVFAWYDSRIEARFDGPDRMVGIWSKTVPSGVSSLSFAATRGTGDRFLPVAEEGLESGPADASPSIAGIWEVAFTDEDGTEPARGEFEQTGSQVSGTFLTPTGDYRFLEGSYENGLLRLSAFDGGHAFLFHARAQADGTLDGDFWSRDTYHATWTASRVDDPQAELIPDAWELVGLNNDEGKLAFTFPDMSGFPVSLTDDRFQGKVVLVNIFGSWCPNCNDEAPLLAEWARLYHDLGLEVVGLAYEFTDDFERSKSMVQRFAVRHQIGYPLLIAGTSDKSAAAETLPDLTSVVAYPTTIFVDRAGTVRKIHSGFSGPGTGEHYEHLVAEMVALIEHLLAEPA